MAISIAYFESIEGYGDKNIRFECDTYRCKDRDHLIQNLQDAGIDYRDNGAHIWVSLSAFSSVEDIEARALKGFTVSPGTRYKPKDDDSRYEYVSIIPSSCEDKARKLVEQAERADSPADAHHAYNTIEAMKVSSRDLIRDAIQEASRPVFRR